MKKWLVALLLLNTFELAIAGTPSTTDSTETLMQTYRPSYYMAKQLVVDMGYSYYTNPPYVITVTQRNNSATNDCTSNMVTSYYTGMNLSGIQFLQIGMMGELPMKTRLGTDNYIEWTGDIYWEWAASVYYSPSFPYWIYDYSALQIICAPVYVDWYFHSIS